MDKFLSILGLCRRAGKLVMGYDASVGSLKESKAKLVIVADQMSPKTEKNALFEANKYNVEFLKCQFTQEEIAIAIGKKAGVFAVLDVNFANGLKEANLNQREKG